jgi:D-galactarolactone cycloisomerase
MIDPIHRGRGIWRRVYNSLRDHGQKGMPIQALSGVDIDLEFLERFEVA